MVECDEDMVKCCGYCVIGIVIIWLLIAPILDLYEYHKVFTDKEWIQQDEFDTKERERNNLKSELIELKKRLVTVLCTDATSNPNGVTCDANLKRSLLGCNHNDVVCNFEQKQAWVDSQESGNVKSSWESTKPLIANLLDRARPNVVAMSAAGEDSDAARTAACASPRSCTATETLLQQVEKLKEPSRQGAEGLNKLQVLSDIAEKYIDHAGSCDSTAREQVSDACHIKDQSEAQYINTVNAGTGCSAWNAPIPSDRVPTDGSTFYQSCN
jgi:hypothetical protein